MIPESMYLAGLSQRDLAGPVVLPEQFFGSFAPVGAIEIGVIYTVPDDKILHLESASISIVPGIFDVLYGALAVQFKGMSAPSNFFGRFNEAASAKSTGIVWIFADSVDITFPPGAKIYGSYRGTGVATTVTGAFTGWLLPRGNLGSS